MYTLLTQLNSYIYVLSPIKRVYFSGILCLFFLIAYPPKVIQKRVSGGWEPIELVVQDFLKSKIQNPWKPAVGFEDSSHFAKRDLRITPYLLGNLLKVEAIKLFYFQVLLFPLFIYFLLSILWRFSNDGISTFYMTIALLFSYVGNSFFFDTLFLDSIGYFGLLISFFLLRSPLLLPLLILTFFVDERTIAPSLVYPLSAYLTNTSSENGEVRAFDYIKKATWLNRTFWFVVLAILAYLFGRYFLFEAFGLTTPVGFKNGVSPIVASKFGWKAILAYFSALKGTILLLLFTVSIGIKNREILSTLWIFVVFFLVSSIGLSVEDITRSVAYGFPIIIVATQYVYHKDSQSSPKWTKEIQLIGLLSLVFPTYTLILDLIHIKAFAWMMK